MSDDKTNLIITAHPDDETIFFAGLILSRPTSNWRVICTTDGNADGMGPMRKKQLLEATSKLGVSDVEMLGFPDQYEKRLDVEALVSHLSKESADAVFTHSILGEYGHPHHQDVSVAAHRAFAARLPVYSIAYNCFPDFKVSLNQKDFELKSKILSEVYLSETQRFIQLLPSRWEEGFRQVDQSETEALYRYLLTGNRPEKSELKAFAWFYPYLQTPRAHPDRPF